MNEFEQLFGEDFFQPTRQQNQVQSYGQQPYAQPQPYRQPEMPLRGAVGDMDLPSAPENFTELTVEEATQLQTLENGLLTADKFVNRNYLIGLAEQKVIPLEEEFRDVGFIRMYELEKVVFDRTENVNDKLISVYSALQNVDSTVLLVIDGEEDKITYYLGVRSIRNASTAGKILEKSFLGNFPGSEMKSMKKPDIETLMNGITQSGYVNTQRNVSCVTVVPSMRDQDKDKFVQGMEKFVDTMQGERYTAIFIASPVGKAELEYRKRGFEELYSAMSPYIKTSLNFGTNYSKAVSKGMSQSFSRSVNNSVTNTTGHSTGTNESFSEGSNSSWGASGDGFSSSSGSSTGHSTGYSTGQTWSKSVTSGTSDGITVGVNDSDTETTGDSRSLTIEYQNKSVANLLETVDQQLKRIQDCEAFGVWECAGYFIADDIQTSVVAANSYKALMLGDETKAENSFVNVWGIRTQEQTKHVLDYMRYGWHPLMCIRPEEGYKDQFVTPANFVSGKELPLLMGLPQKSVTGLTVSHIAEFGRNVFVQNGRRSRKSIHIGRVYHMGKTERQEVRLDLDSFTSHCFVTGSTGSGKSNTTYCLLEQFHEKGVPFLVIEPAKGEYKTAFGGMEGIHIFTTNPAMGQMLKINPFRFDPNIHVLEHLDRLIEIFNACWEMYAAMPAILKDAIERIYVEKGWDLCNSVYMRPGNPVYPDFRDLLRTLPQVIDSSSYSSDTKGDYTGALVTRVASLTKGITGQVFCDQYDIPDSVIFDENAIVDLSRVGSLETKSLIMGLLVLKLNEYRMANAEEANQGLRHVTVLEEAHNLLKRTSDANGSGANPVGKSVEMICNGIAEMRTYGEGFLIVDQSPTAVDIAAIKNTNTKILMRLPEKNDCEAVGNSVGLNEEQIRELAKLGTGIAAVMQNNWLEAVLTRIDRASEKFEKKFTVLSYPQIKSFRTLVLKEYMRQYIEDRKMDYGRMEQVIDSAKDIPREKKEEMRCCMKFFADHLSARRDIDFFCQSLMNITGSSSLFDNLQNEISGNEEIGREVDRWHRKLMDGLREYVDFSDNMLRALSQYLIYHRGMEAEKVNYGKIYDHLF